jgi:acyl-CoA reductase-like NAD-dependent aldehyde dehydrogenase
VFQYLHLSDASAESLVRHPGVDFIAFTGSVAVGRKVQLASAARFVGMGLELGGKDAAYVRQDADVPFAVENIVDGVCFNSGQSCCAVERVYVHASIFDQFVSLATSLASRYVLGDPRDPITTLGPVVNGRSAQFIRKQMTDAIDSGAKTLVDEALFTNSSPGSLYVAPQLLIDVDHSMSIMHHETFGPVAGIMRVESDDEAIRLINDSKFGLTASVWTADVDVAQRLGESAEVGTWFMNRCDYLDPLLAWTGVKDSGRGCTLSEFGFDQLTHPKSFHLRTNP